MSKSTYGVRRAGVASLATLSLVSVAAVAGAGSASAVADFKFERVGGADRYETSTLVADRFATVNPDVILANGEPGNYADALSANTLAGEMGAPVLLTRKDKTPASVLTQLQEDGVKNITVVGGESVVSAAQVAALTAAGYNVTRVAGVDRFGTNADIIAASGAAVSSTGLIATGFNFPDALSAGPISYAGHPLGLSTGTDIDQEVIDALKGVGVNKVLVFGGESAVSPAVVAKLAANGITVTQRFAGSDRSETSQLAAEYAVKNLSFTDTHVGVASGYVEGFGADALAGGPLEGKEKSPMLVTRDVNNPDNVLDYLKAHAETLKDGHLYGGPAAISTAAQAAMEKAAQSVSTNADFAVTPAANAALTVASPDDTTDDRTYTVNGLDDTKAYTVALFPCANVTKDANGVYTFKDTDTNDKADDEAAAPAADITKVNSTTIAAADTAQATPVNGTINFTIDGVAAGCAVPVVYLNAGTAGLDLNAANQPTEFFGVGGNTTYNATEAASGPFGTTPVASVDKANNTFSTAAFSYKYDANDNYFVDGASVGLTAFEAALSTGDDITGTYASDPEGVSIFALDDIAPPAPTSVEAEKGTTAATTNDITVTVVIPAGADYDSVVIQRATVTGGTDDAADGTVGTFATIATPTTDANTTVAGFQYVDNDVPAGTYRYRAALVNDGDQGDFATDNNETSTNPVVDNTAPRATDARVATNTGNLLLINDGDSFKVVFDEVMAAPTAGDTIRVTDSDGSVYDLVNGSGVAYTLNGGTENVGGTDYPAGRVLTVSITTLPAPATAGSIGGLNIPATITAQSGTTDSAGNQWNLAGSSDLVIDSE